MDPVSIAIAGAGRMGRAVASAAEAADDTTLASVWARNPVTAGEFGVDGAVLISDDIDTVVAACDVLIDFSLPDATNAVVDAVTRHKKPLVCGVSGLDDAQQALLDAAATQIALVYDRNMSLGVAVLASLVEQAASALGSDFDVLVRETHHIHKIDAPSGTALKLGELIAAARGSAADEIHYDVERRGEVPGDHTVVLSSATEQLTLAHSVTTRKVFADGAIRAARWIASQAPARYTMQDVLQS